MKTLTKEDLPIGTKVVPHSKTIEKPYTFSKCPAWNDLGGKKQGFLYVRSYLYEGGVWLNTSNTKEGNSSLYNYSDLTLYEESKKTFDNPTNEEKEMISHWIDKLIRESRYSIVGFEARSFIEKHLSPELKIEVGRWYKSKDPKSSFMVFIESFESPDDDYNSVKSFGFSKLGEWMNSELRDSLFLTGHCEEATEQEVTERLIEEAKRRGFVKGCIISNSGINEGMLRSIFRPLSGDFIYFSKCNILDTRGGTGHVFDNGKWAEIIKPKPTELEDAIKALDDATEKLKNLLK